MKKVVLFRVRNQMNGVSEIPIDRLNELPDSILIHILSFLTLKEAAATCVLAKRWQFLWSDVPSLRLWESENENEDPQQIHRFVALAKTRRFVACVNRLFAIRTTNSMEKFSLRMQYIDSFSDDIDEWICNALNRRVKTLILIIHSGHLNSSYILPDEICTSSSLEYLLIQGHIIFRTNEIVSWRSLTELYLEYVELMQEVVDDILSNCPVLHMVEFKRCFGFYHLVFKSPNIHTIVIEDEHDKDWMYISAPNLRFLDMTFYPRERGVKLGDIRSLYKARINFTLDGSYPDDEAIVSYTKELLKWIHHVQELQLNPQCFEVISMLAATGWKLPRSTRCRLEVSSSVAYKYNVSGIMALLESSPNLETLVLEGFNPSGSYAFPNPAANDELISNLLCPKNIYFRNYTDSNGEPMLTLVRILLKTAPFLENMEVIIDGVESSDDFTRIYKELLLFPRVNAISSESHQYENKSRYRAAVIFR